VVSYPLLSNDVFWQNRDYHIAVGGRGPGTLNQQNLVSLYNGSTATLAPSQTTTGVCTAANYWDIGVRGDTGPGNHNSTITLAPSFSVLTAHQKTASARMTRTPTRTLSGSIAHGSRIITGSGDGGRGLAGASWHCGRNRAQPNLQPRAQRDGGRGQQLGQHQLGPADDVEPSDRNLTTSTPARKLLNHSRSGV